MELQFINEIEQAEVLAWKDMYDAAPKEFAERMQVSYKQLGGGLVLMLGAIPAAHFNMAIGLGTGSPMTAGIVDEIMQLYKDKHPRSFMILHFDQMTPAGCIERLSNHGLEAVNGWERILRDNSPQARTLSNPDDLIFEEVRKETQEKWAKYICDAYGLPFHEWLHALVGREGWHHYMALKEGRIVAVRSWYITPGKWAWSGVEAPVPGIMTQQYQQDFLLWEHAINELKEKDVKYYVADIERIDDSKDLPSYEVFTRHFGFTIPYRRLHYTYNIK